MKTVGILGAGQLAQMLAEAAPKLKLKTLCLAKTPDDCAKLTSTLIFNEAELLAQSDCLTLETENIPLKQAEFLSDQKPLYPNIEALRISQDRGHEKLFFNRLNIRTTSYCLINRVEDLTEAQAELGYPFILKTRQFGYDGKGQFLIKNETNLAHVAESFTTQPMIAEGFVNFDYEVSLIGARNHAGQTAFYPLARNTHHQGILIRSEAPFEAPDLQRAAEHIMKIVFDELDYIGVMAIEFFVKNDVLIVNEMAPRVHNTGHWTIEGARTSQFEQHLRAITGMPLGPTEAIGHSIMLNCIGSLPDADLIESTPYAHFHPYGKAPAKGRKLGHITLTHTSLDEISPISQAVSIELWPSG